MNGLEVVIPEVSERCEPSVARVAATETGRTIEPFVARKPLVDLVPVSAEWTRDERTLVALAIRGEIALLTAQTEELENERSLRAIRDARDNGKQIQRLGELLNMVQKARPEDLETSRAEFGGYVTEVLGAK